MDPSGLGSPLAFSLFIAFVLAMLALDLGVLQKRHAGPPTPREAGLWSALWVGLSLLFALGVAVSHGATPAVEFLTGYAIEKALSVDNIFVFVVIFSALRIPAEHQHRVLFWGVLSALVLRGAMIFGGLALLERFHGLVYVFGAFLAYTGYRLYKDRNAGPSSAPPPMLAWLRRVLPSTDTLDGGRFLTRVDGAWRATPLLLALVLVELTDVVFALDSVPAIFAVTRDPFIVFTSNILAILGLRSLFFFLASAVERFPHLKTGLAAVLVFVGAKLALVDLVHVPPLASLAVVSGLLGGSIWASVRAGRPAPEASRVDERRLRGSVPSTPASPAA